MDDMRLLTPESQKSEIGGGDGAEDVVEHGRRSSGRRRPARWNFAGTTPMEAPTRIGKRRSQP